jgi:hypothetical protein
MAHTFISFSSKDIEMALRVHDALTIRGIDCWISKRDIPTGANYQEEIARAIKTASIMVLIFSENANSSNNIPDEIALAKKNHLVLMPLKINEYLEEDAFELNLATSQYIDLYQDFEKIIEEVAVTIKAINERQDNFTALLAQHSGDDVFKPHIKDWLLQEAKERKLTKGQAEKIINQVLGRTNHKESELEYLKLIEQVLEDGIVSSIEVLMLSKKAKQLGISLSRADELLAHEKKKLGIYDSPITEETTVVLQSVLSNLSPISDENSLNQDDEALEGPLLQDEGIFNDLKLDISNKINVLIENNSNVRKFKDLKNKLLFQFQPNYLYENIQVLKDFGLLTSDDNLADNTVFLFEINLRYEHIVFRCFIGPGTQSTRERLYNIYKAHRKVFTKVVKSSGQLSPSWHQAHQKQILSKNEMQLHLENKLDIDTLIDVRIRDLFEIDIPKMMNCIDKEMNSNDDYDNLYTYQEDNDLSGPSVWHLNTGGRSWKDQMTFHYWIAGGGKKWSDIIRKLKIGDEVFAYLSGKGYVGHGFVKGEPIILNDYVVMHGEFKNQKLSNLSIESSTLNAMNENRQITNVDDYEYVISVEWVAALDENDAKSEKGLHISPLTGCKMNNKTLDFLRSVF